MKAKLARLGALSASLAIVSLLVVTGSRAAFSDTTTNGSNTFAAGNVDVNDDDAGSVMFTLANMKPGDTATRCINVSYIGSLTADVKLYGVVGGTGLATHLDVDVDMGATATGGATFNCTGFVESNANVFANTLATFGTTHTNFANGIANYAGATNPTTKSYRFTVTLPSAAPNAAQGLNASATFTWEAQSV